MKEILHVLSEMFGWPAGIVVGNLIASFLIWQFLTVPLVVWHHLKLKKHINNTVGTRE